MEGRCYPQWEDFKYFRNWEVSELGLSEGCVLIVRRQLQHIYENTLQEYPGVGVLSASNRDIWAKVGLPISLKRSGLKCRQGLYRTREESR